MVLKKGNNKKIPLILGMCIVLSILFILLIVLAKVSVDSKEKFYNKETKTIIIEENETELLRATLKTAQTEKINFLGYQKVAEFSIIYQKGVEDFLGNFEFYDLKTNKSINKSVDIKYLVREITEIPIYSFCKWDDKKCKQVRNGSVFELRNKWINFDNKAKKGEEIRIALFTNVSSGEKIEWIPTISDIKIDEWASWQVDTFFYNNKNFSFATQESTGDGFFFKSDGTKMYIMGSGTDRVYQYSLSTAWDVSTATYDNKNFSFASEDSNPLSIWFNGSGTKMYASGITTGKIYQYTLSSAWDVSTASYDSVSLNVAPVDANDQGMTFSTDGTKFYLMGGGTDRVYLYNLTTAWNLSTATYNNYNFSVTTEDGTPQDVLFNSDGTKMWMVGSATDTIYQYSLSTAWNIATATYDSASLNVSTQESMLTDLFFNESGDTLFIMGNDADMIFQFLSGYLNVTSTFPETSKNFTTKSIYLSSKVSISGVGITNVTLFLNGSNNGTNVSGFEGVYNFSRAIPDGFWNYTFDAYGDDGLRYPSSNGTLNFSIDSTAPQITINTPTGTVSSLTVPFNFSLTEAGTLHTCRYWVMRGASPEIANTTATCSSTINGSFVVSADASYVFHVFVNDTFGNSNISTSNFTVNTASAGAPSGGGGGFLTNILEEEEPVVACISFKEAFASAIKTAKEEQYTKDKIIAIINAFWDYIICKSASSIVPL